jgi:hypothetical protein
MRFPGHHAACFKRTLLHDNRADIWMNDGNLGTARLLPKRTLRLPDRTRAVVFPECGGSGYEGYAIAVSNAHLQVYPQENNRYETRDALACVAA